MCGRRCVWWCCVVLSLTHTALTRWVCSLRRGAVAGGRRDGAGPPPRSPPLLRPHLVPGSSNPLSTSDHMLDADAVNNNAGWAGGVDAAKGERGRGKLQPRRARPLSAARQPPAANARCGVAG
eukprot:2802296-Rhodomonas_salina.2